MDDILGTAKEYWKVVATRAIAHEKSAEWHRRRGTQLGTWSTAMSAVVGTTIFATITSQVGFNVKGNITLPEGGNITLPGGVEPWLIYVVFAFLLFATPVLTGVQTYLNHPEQAEMHKISWTGYYRLQQRIDLFLLRYVEVNTNTTNRGEALKELEDISKEIGFLSENSITLTPQANAEAEKELLKKQHGIMKPNNAI